MAETVSETVEHPFHLVEPSPWPIVGSVAGVLFTAGAALWMHGMAAGPWLFWTGVALIAVTMIGWWRDVLRESREGHHTLAVSHGLRLGMALFITSEVFFFFAFFWAWFWGALVPPETFPVSWPPEGVEPVPTWEIPFLNTLILLASGATVTWAHHAVRHGDNRTGFKALVLTVLLGLTFTFFQGYEYYHTIVHEGFDLTDGIFGSAFYMATGFHGLHVQIGTVFLIVCAWRAWKNDFTPEQHVGLEAAAWYWHFVDVVWLFLFTFVYWWGGSLHFTVTPVQ